MMNWIEIGALTDIPKLGSRIVRLGGLDIAVFRNEADAVFALNDKCPHKGGPLSQGIVHGNNVTCPLHNFIISLESGEARAPDKGCTKRYETRIINGVVALKLPAKLSEAAE